MGILSKLTFGEIREIYYCLVISLVYTLNIPTYHFYIDLIKMDKKKKCEQFIIEYVNKIAL